MEKAVEAEANRVQVAPKMRRPQSRAVEAGRNSAGGTIQTSQTLQGSLIRTLMRKSVMVALFPIVHI